MSIFAQYLKPARSMQEYSQDYDAAEQNKLALAARRMQMQQAQSGMEDQQRIRGLASQYGGDENALIKALRGGGYFEQAGGIEKQIAERLKAQGERDKAGRDNSAADEKLFGDRWNNARTFVGGINSPQGAEAYVRGIYADPVLGPRAQALQPLELALQEIPKDATTLPRWKAAMSAISAEKLIELTNPKMQTVNAGNAQVTQGTDQFTGQVIPGTERSTPILQSADNAATQASAAEQRAQQQRQYEETKRFEREKFGYQQKKDAEKPAPGAAPAKPMPAAAMRMQDDDLNAIGTFAGIDKDLEGIQKQLETGKLNLGLVGNITGDVRNRVGRSNENSRNLATFKAKLENMRNSVLLLNKGVQTEGDAQRAMNEMIANINDPDVVKQRLKEIRALNQRAVQLKKNNLDMLRRNYGQEDMDYSKYENQPPATNLPSGNPLSPEDTQARDWALKNPNDPRAKQIMQRLGG